MLLANAVRTHSDSMKCRKVLPKSALSCAVENLVGTNSEGRNGPFDMECLRAKRGPAFADPLLCHWLRTGLRRIRWNDSPIGYAITVRGHWEVLRKRNRRICPVR